MPVQSVLFVKAAPHLWKTAPARKWLVSHGYTHAISSRRGPHIAFEQFKKVPGASYRTVTVPGKKGIKMVIDTPKRGAAKVAAAAADIGVDVTGDVAAETVERFTSRARNVEKGEAAGAGSSTSTSEFEYIVTKRRKIPKSTSG